MTNRAAPGRRIAVYERTALVRPLAVLIARKPVGAVALAVLVLMLFAALFAQQIAPYPPRVATGPNLDPPSLAHLFGTDFVGRDILSRVIYGARVSLFVGVGSVLLGTVVGMVMGIMSGYFRGWIEALIQRAVDAAMAIPLILLAVVIVSLVPPSLNNIVFALAFAIAPRTSRVVHSATIAVRSELFIEAARAVGCRPMRILQRHVLPNILAPIIVVASVIVGGAIIAESSLSFLGLSDPSEISWGAMLSGDGRQYMVQAPWSAVFPGAAIMLIVLAFNLLGDAVRDLLDPRLRM